MAQNSSFFNAELVNGQLDRTYSATDWAEYFATFLGNGVAPQPTGGLSVQAGQGMQVIVASGSAFINGYRYANTTPLTLNINPLTNNSYGRITNIVVELNLSTRNILIQTVDGTPTPNPQAPQLVQNEGIYQLCLAQINIPATSSQITSSMITDTRSNETLCGFIAGLFGENDNEEIENQINAINQSLSNCVTTSNSPTLNGTLFFADNEGVYFNNTNGDTVAGFENTPSDEIALLNNLTSNYAMYFTPESSGIDTLNFGANVNLEQGFTIQGNPVFPIGGGIENQTCYVNNIECNYSLSYYLVNGNGAQVQNNNGQMNTMFGVLALDLTPQSSGNMFNQVIQLPGTPLEDIADFQVTPLDSSQNIVIGEIPSSSSIQIWLANSSTYQAEQGTTIYLRALITN